MKEATGELNMTIIVIIAVAAILGFLTIFLPDVFRDIRERWANPERDVIDYEAYHIPIDVIDII
jgi:hypothetical protein